MLKYRLKGQIDKRSYFKIEEVTCNIIHLRYVGVVGERIVKKVPIGTFLDKFELITIDFTIVKL